MTKPEAPTTKFPNGTEVSKSETGLFVKKGDVTLVFRDTGNHEVPIHIRAYSEDNLSAMDMFLNKSGSLISVRELQNVPTKLADKVVDMTVGIDDVVFDVTGAGNQWHGVRDMTSDGYTKIFSKYLVNLGEEAVTYIAEQMRMSGFPYFNEAKSIAK